MGCSIEMVVKKTASKVGSKTRVTKGATKTALTTMRGVLASKAAARAADFYRPAEQEVSSPQTTAWAF
jgi:hypothetical protein